MDNEISRLNLGLHPDSPYVDQYLINRICLLPAPKEHFLVLEPELKFDQDYQFLCIHLKLTLRIKFRYSSASINECRSVIE